MTDHPFTILIVDEDAEARDQWVGILQAEEQHELIAVRGEEEAATYLKARPFNMIVVDVTDKEQQEMAFIPAYRQRWPNCLVIVTTAQGSLETAVRALRLGAFDYLVKPLRPEDMRATFNRAQAAVADCERKEQLISVMEEMLQRLKAPLSYHPVYATRLPTVISRGGLVLDLDRRTASRWGQTVNLTPTEFDVLALLAAKPGQPFTSEEILDTVKGYTPSSEGAKAAMRVYVSRLRQKIEEDADQPRHLLTVRGVGYMFSD
jgi:DNA-binding response OmpR family regulator